ncbi:MAG: FIG002781: Alpha-L-glutamate ligase family protein [uncultured Rubrobacteraceae bacterium]|uniref:FIG002781: Alpha-L-glutamate ligase family protein n=1 Tax=uncultured Rubrobacteraceae bacterium TaxID=349277 RepID=A0A6J4R3B0_9ACTN|nr:MAG: FIG002781: Alpha-L-glutamate ligase family protein [uncultured Rubrobacteraceae bacterium]
MPTGDGRGLREILRDHMPPAVEPIGKRRSWREILGMNARTLMVDRENSPQAIRFVDNKEKTKDALEEIGVPVPPTVELVRDRRDLANLDWNNLPDAWVLKPNMGRQGAGILAAAEREDNGEGDGWRTASGRRLSRSDLVDHLRSVLDGEFSPQDVENDWVLFEKLVVPHEALARLVPQGLPDIRIICYHSEPLLAMLRLPTNASDGRANLHQGALGAAVDLGSGCVSRALFKGREITEHPDTGHDLIGAEVPYWGQILDAASSCSDATGLGYLGVDMVTDEELGPLVMEVNARPGLQAQNVNGVGLADRLKEVTGSRPSGPV